MKSILAITVSGLLLMASGCAKDEAADSRRVNHFANRSNRIGSNIPQPASAGSDSDAYNTSEAERMQRQGSNTSAMQGPASVGGGVH